MSVDGTSPKTENNLLEQIMREALAFHQSGQQQEAEKLYLSILDIEPNDPKANHNLGALYVQMGEPAVGLKYFAGALDSEPACGQYWLSYIDALFQAGQLDESRQVLLLALQNGLQGEDADALAIRLEVDASQLDPIYRDSEENPTTQEIDNLVALFTEGRSKEAMSLAKTMTKHFPEHYVGWKMLGVIFSQMGQNENALIPMQKAVALNPNDAEAHNNLGIILQNMDQMGEAEASYRRALKINPTYAQAHGNLGSTLQKLGRLAHAEASYKTAIQLDPNYAKAYSNLGSLLQELGRLDEAVSSYRRAIQLNPNIAGYYLGLGNTFEALGRLEQAEASYNCAIQIKADFVEAICNMGIVLQKQGKFTDAEICYRRTLEFKPDYFDALVSLGSYLQDRDRLAEAEANYRRAIAIDPDRAEPHCNLGIILQEMGHHDEAEISMRRAIQIKPDFAKAYNNLGAILNDLGCLGEAEAHFRQALAIQPDYVKAYSNLLFQHIQDADKTPANYLMEARQYGQIVAQKVSRFNEWRCSPQPDRLRVGLVSGDFSNHPIAYFLESVLAHIDSATVELIAYSTNHKTDEFTDRLKPHFVAWRSLVGQSDEDAARLIRGDGVHVLIDLSGHTRHNRLPVFAWKPAPVQASWQGYLASTGVTEIDYFLGDPYVAPACEAHHFTERIWQLPESYMCFTEPEVALEVAVPPSLVSGGITFGCLNNLTKMGDASVALWARVLKAVAGSKLLLKTKLLNEIDVREAVIRRYAAHGIPADRLILEGAGALTRSEYLSTYNRIDIALDPFPYVGCTTSIEALWMGVPIITKRGDRFLSHVGETILHNAGMRDWIAVDADDYVAKAVAFAANPEKLAKIRAGLRQQVLASPLFDAERFARHLEEALWKMWSQWLGQSKET